MTALLLFNHEAGKSWLFLHHLILPGQAYDPFGLMLQQAGSGDALFGFMGAQAGGMGLLYVDGRYYNPRKGRFLSPNNDNFNPKRPGTLNPYLSIIFLGPLVVLVGRRRLQGKKRYITIWLLCGLAHLLLPSLPPRWRSHS
jgi:RHS repeat-associated protein